MPTPKRKNWEHLFKSKPFSKRCFTAGEATLRRLIYLLSEKKVYSEKKRFAPFGNKFFHFRVYPFSGGNKLTDKRAKMALYRLPDNKTSLSIGLLVQEKKFNTDFQDSGHLVFQIRMILATFDLQVTSILPMKFQINCTFGSGEKVQNRFSTGLLTSRKHTYKILTPPNPTFI